MVQKKLKRAVCVLLLLATLLTMAPVAGASAAEARASMFFNSTDAWVSRAGSGKIRIEADVTAISTMKQLGTSRIDVYKKNLKGTYSLMKTYLWDETDGMKGTNTIAHYTSIYYQGTAGWEYYAVVTFRAINSSGEGSYKYTTAPVTA